MARRRNSGITSLRFNQDQGCFTCCLTTGLRVYNVNPLVEKTHYSLDEVGEVSLCEMIHRTNWLLVVRAARPTVLLVLDDKSRTFAAEVTFNSPIRALRARRDKVAVVLTSSVQVLTLPTLHRVALLRTPASAQRPICALATAPTATHQTLVVPAHRRGAIQILDVSRVTGTSTSNSPAVVSCHVGAIAEVTVNAGGLRVVTASSRGTLLRVWDSQTRGLLHELRRGADCAQLYCININPSGTQVCCVSDKGTLHVWTCGRVTGHVTTAVATNNIRAHAAFLDDHTPVVISEDGTFHKFTYSAEGSCQRSDFEYFLQVGDDDDFIQ